VSRAVFYVDGMNTYHGFRSKYGREFLRLDWFALAPTDPPPRHRLTVRYFTTIVAVNRMQPGDRKPTLPRSPRTGPPSR
jgi:hypothetical protein